MAKGHAHGCMVNGGGVGGMGVQRTRHRLLLSCALSHVLITLVLLSCSLLLLLLETLRETLLLVLRPVKLCSEPYDVVFRFFCHVHHYRYSCIVIGLRRPRVVNLRRRSCIQQVVENVRQQLGRGRRRE